MKILHVIDSSGLYGAEVMLLTLAAEQQRLGCEPVIASLGGRHGDAALQRAASAQGTPFEAFALRPGPDLAGLVRLLRSARRQQVDVLHAHGYKASILLGLVPGWLRGRPLVMTVHGWTGTAGRSRMAAYRWLHRKVLRRADHLVLVSRELAGRIGPDDLPAGRYSVIRNGLPEQHTGCPAPPGGADPQLASFGRPGRRLVSCGRLSAEKGFVVLIRAVRLLRERGLDVSLLILGEGPQRPALEQLVDRLGLTGRVLLPGFRPAADTCLAPGDLYVNSSFSEGLPMSLLEAVRAGVPIVATRVGGIPELLEDERTALLVAPGEPDALAAAAERLLRHPQRAERLARQAKSLLAGEFGSRQMARAYAAVYRGLASRSPAVLVDAGAGRKP